MAEEFPVLETLAERLQWARERAGFASPREAARAFDWNENTYKSHENGVRGVRGLPEAVLKRYGRAFRVPWEWIGFGRIAAPSGSLGRLSELWSRIDERDRPAAERMLEGLAEQREDRFDADRPRKRTVRRRK